MELTLADRLELHEIPGRYGDSIDGYRPHGCAIDDELNHSHVERDDHDRIVVARARGAVAKRDVELSRHRRAD